MTEMLAAALALHNESLCIIPVVSGDKMPAIAWEEYQYRTSTRDEIMEWFSNGHGYNIGVVHGSPSQNYIALDFDHDAGLFEAMRAQFPALFTGRLEQSGSGEGYHLPLRVETLPDLGHDARRDRPKGNVTYKTGQGSCNLRCRWCQTVTPPSRHPSGGQYVYIQDGPIATTATLRDVMAWLNELAPIPTRKAVSRRDTPAQVGDAANLLEAVKAAWPESVAVFAHFGLVGETRRERNNEIRLLGNGGLLVAEDKTTWYNFSTEEGGGVIEAWAWCRFGSVASKQGRFRSILLEMAQAAGVDVARFHKRGDERTAVEGEGDRARWTRERGAGAWGRMR